MNTLERQQVFRVCQKYRLSQNTSILFDRQLVPGLIIIGQPRNEQPE